MFSGKIILMDTLTVVAVTIIILLGFSVNYLLDPDIRQTALNFVLWIFGALLIFSAVKSFYLGEMSTFTASEGEVKILMDKNPLVSIVTTCFNAEKTIERTIKSVINQNYSNIEYIIIDACSTDKTIKYRRDSIG